MNGSPAVAPSTGGIARKRTGATTAFHALLLVAATSSPAAIAQAPAEETLRKLFEDIRVDASYLYDDNVNRGQNGEPQLSEQFFGLAAAKNFTFPIDATRRVLLDLTGGGELTRSFPKLGRVFGEIQPTFRYRKSADFHAPTIDVFARLSAEHFGSSLRSGYRSAIGVSALQPVTDRMDLFGVLSYNWRNANSQVFDGEDFSAQLTLDYSFGARGTFYAVAEYRRGDVVSTATESLVNLDIAKFFVADDAYTNPQLFSYRFEAYTVIGTLGYNMPLGRGSSIDISWRIARSTPTESATFQGAGTPHYVDNQFMLVYSRRF
jgi:hypothetical protein